MKKLDVSINGRLKRVKFVKENPFVPLVEVYLTPLLEGSERLTPEAGNSAIKRYNEDCEKVAWAYVDYYSLLQQQKN